MIINGKEFEIGKRTYIMGILNVTPDSFSDGGNFNQLEKAREHVNKMIQGGADIIDVGGESTRPNYTQVSDEEEIARVVPVIQMIQSEFDIAISIDTYKSKVAEAAIKAGAGLVNDIWGFKADSHMAEVVKKYEVACCLMHNRKEKMECYSIEEVQQDLRESLSIAQVAGIKKDKIMIDPGIGFAKTYEQNLITMNHLERLRELGYPILLGTSRKSMIGNALDLPVDQRVEGTIATTVIGMMKGACDFVRVHDVEANKRAALMTDAILRS